MSTQNTQGRSLIERIVRAIAAALKTQCGRECQRREQIRWLSLR